MPGFVVGAHDLVAGELWLYVETIAERLSRGLLML
jgi:hypothetical protein